MLMAKSGAFTIRQIDAASADCRALEKPELAFRPIDNTADERSFGLMSFDDETEPLGTTPIQKGQYICAKLRLDTRRIAPAVYKKHLNAAIKKELDETARKFIPKERRAEIRDMIKLSLLAKAEPVPSLTDVIIDAESGRAYICSTNKKIVQMADELLGFAFGSIPAPVDVHSIIDAGEFDYEAPLGSYFTTWLAVHAMQGQRDWLQIGETLTLGDGDTIIAARDVASEFQEARKAIELGKMVQRASVRIYRDDESFEVKIKDNFQLAITTPFSKSPPMIVNAATGAAEDAEEDAAFFDKMGYVETAIALLEGLVQEFAAEYHAGPTAMFESIRTWARVE